LIKRIIEGKFIQVDRYTKIEKHKYLIYESEDKNIILYLIDINSDNDNNKSFKDYFKNADCIIMGYDVTNKKSLQEIIDYGYKQAKELSKTDLIYLLGNKIDLEGNVKSIEKEGNIFSELAKFFESVSETFISFFKSILFPNK
jgi:GTPase SAR1 family protein